MINSYRTRALLLLPLFANIGTLLGPLIGGLLSDNSQGSSRSQHPYLLPNLVVCTIYFTSALGMAFWLQETSACLQDLDETVPQRYWRLRKQYISKVGRKSQSYEQLSRDEIESPTSPEVELLVSPTSPQSARAPFIPKKPKKPKKLSFRKIWTFNVICTMVSHFIIGGHLGTFSLLWAIFLSTPVGAPSEQHSPLKFNGGLGMRPRDVGFAMSLLGGIGVILQMFFYPKLQDRFGTIRIWKSTLYIFPVVYLLAPYPSLVASATGLKSQVVWVWISMCAVLFLYVLGRTGVTPATTLLINDCTPHPSVRGTIHTTATVVNNLARSVFPMAAMAIFGQGMRIGIVGLGFWSIAALAILSCIASRWVVEGSNGAEIVLEEEEEEGEEEEPQTRTTPAT
jgi:MFS family permease